MDAVNPSTSPTARESGGSSAQGVLLVVAAAFVTQTGAAIAVSLFDHVGATGAVFLRLVIAAVVLCAVVRPSPAGLTRHTIGVVLTFGAALGGMNLLIYQAIARLPLGIAVTIELLGPLALSVVLSRKWSGVLWAALALAGVVLLSGVGPGSGVPDLAGVFFAMAAAAMWAVYILMSRQAGRSFPGTQGLAWAMVVGAVLAAPFGIASGGAALLEPRVLLVGLAVALLSSALPYALELASLRRLAAETFSILVSMAPAVAALVGWLILGQVLGPLEIAGMVLVILAGAAAVRAGRPPSTGPTPPGT